MAPISAAMTAGRLKSEAFSATINLGGHEADEADIKRVLGAGAKQALKAEREVIHSLPVGFSLDAERGVRDPRGMGDLALAGARFIGCFRSYRGGHRLNAAALRRLLSDRTAFEIVETTRRERGRAAEMSAVNAPLYAPWMI